MAEPQAGFAVCERCKWRRPVGQDSCPGCSGGYKVDGDKLRWDLMPSDALEEVARVMTHGAKKYAPRNWERGMAWSRPFGALMRHAWAWWRGEDNDPETGISHLAHAACCVLFLLAYQLRRDMAIHDDRERLDQRDPRAIHKPKNPGEPPVNWPGRHPDPLMRPVLSCCGVDLASPHAPDCNGVPR